MFSFQAILRDVAFVVCCFIVVSYRPQRIQSPGLFKLGCFLWAVSLVIPYVLYFGLGSIGLTSGFGRNSGGGSMLFIAQMAGPAFFGGAFVCVMMSIVGNGYFPEPEDD
jgi:hypothetical protein